ncbi:unnamed protein product [Urochloa humidicola]
MAYTTQATLTGMWAIAKTHAKCNINIRIDIKRLEPCSICFLSVSLRNALRVPVAIPLLFIFVCASTSRGDET